MTDTAATGMKFRGALTSDELDRLCISLRANAMSGFLELWDLLLVKAGQPSRDQQAHPSIRPDEYSIPLDQAQALVAAIEPDNPEMHFAWVLAWIDHGPTWHND